MTKQEFFIKFESELSRCGVIDRSEILADFEQHFQDSLKQGLNETEICTKLGDISEIAKQYAEAEIYPAVAVINDINSDSEQPTSAESSNTAYSEYENSGIKVDFSGFKRQNKNEQTPENNSFSTKDKYSPPPYENSGIKFNTGNINVANLIVVLCIDVFVLSWALPSLFAISIGLLSIPFALIISGIAAMFGSAFAGNAWFFWFPMSTLPTLAMFFAGLMLIAFGGLLGAAGVALVKLLIKIIRSLIDWHGTMIFGKPVFKSKKEVNVQ